MINHEEIIAALDAMEQGDYSKLDALSPEQVEYMKKLLAYLEASQ